MSEMSAAPKDPALKCCPICGGVRVRGREEDGGVSCECAACGARSRACSTPEEAARAWNARDGLRVSRRRF